MEVGRAQRVDPVPRVEEEDGVLGPGGGGFGGSEEVSQYEKRIAQLEPMLGQKEVEVALLKISWAGAGDRKGYVVR